MTAQRATHFPQGINTYVPALQMVSELVHNSPYSYSLGTPAATDPDGIDTNIDADGAAGTETAQSYTADSPFGRTIVMQMNSDPGAAGGVYDVYGFDYLGQPMVERFTHVNGSTAIIYGKKAFYKVTNVVNVTAATNAVTVDLGWGRRLGLPFKGDIMWAKEAGAHVRVAKWSEWVWRDIAGAAVAGGASGTWIHAPFPGYIKTLRGTANLPAGSTNDPAVTVEIATVAVTGLAVTLDTSAAATEADAVEVDTPTTAGYSANNRFATGDHIEIVVADADSAGAISVGLELVPTQVLQGVETDPATAITGDPRGTYEPVGVPDGSIEFMVGLNGDNSVNASGNGGLHGIRHYYA